MHAWLIARRVKTADGTGLARAVDYTLKRWPALIRYVGYGHLPIDNNPVENTIRPIALGKKMAVRQLRTRRPSCRRHSESAGHHITEWPRALCLAQRHPRTTIRVPALILMTSLSTSIVVDNDVKQHLTQQRFPPQINDQEYKYRSICFFSQGGNTMQLHKKIAGLVTLATTALLCSGPIQAADITLRKR